MPDDYEIDFHVFKPCDYWFDEVEKDENGFMLEIYDTTHKRGYEGYIRWWAVRDLDDGFEARVNAYATGLAKVVRSLDPYGHDDGIVAVKFPSN